MNSRVLLTHDQPRPEQAGPTGADNDDPRSAGDGPAAPNELDQMMAWTFLAGVEAGARQARVAEMRRVRSGRRAR